MIRVVAAMIYKGDRFMICQRPRHKARGLLWEFPGGKVEPGETDAQALIRECAEELNAEIEVGDLFADVTHEYPDITVRLLLYKAKLISDGITLLEHNDARYILPSECEEYDFCPADAPIIKKIISEAKGV